MGPGLRGPPGECGGGSMQVPISNLNNIPGGQGGALFPDMGRPDYSRLSTAKREGRSMQRPLLHSLAPLGLALALAGAACGPAAQTPVAPTAAAPTQAAAPAAQPTAQPATAPGN